MQHTATRIVTIAIEERDSGTFRATCEDLPGFYMAHPDRDAIIEDIPSVIRGLFKLKGEDIIAFLLPEDESMTRFFTLPAHIAAEQLNAAPA